MALDFEHADVLPRRVERRVPRLVCEPLNDRKLALYPNVLRSRPGTFATFSARGQEGNGAVAPWMVETHRNGGVLWLTTHRASPTMPQPWMETQTIFGAERELDDPKQPNLPTTFTPSYSAPYLKWMEMGDLPGHLLWHSSGRKLAGLDELPRRTASVPTRCSRSISRRRCDPRGQPVDSRGPSRLLRRMAVPAAARLGRA